MYINSNYQLVNDNYKAIKYNSIVRAVNESNLCFEMNSFIYENSDIAIATIENKLYLPNELEYTK